MDGLVPLALLAAILLVGVAVITGARLVLAPQGFDLEQQVVVILAAVSLLVAAAVYAVTCVRTLRQVRTLEGAGNQTGARGMLWGLLLSALVVLVPIIVAALVPQHPAP
jgi:hypothetical protein